MYWYIVVSFLSTHSHSYCIECYGNVFGCHFNVFPKHMNRILDIRCLPWLIIKRIHIHERSSEPHLVLTSFIHLKHLIDCIQNVAFDIMVKLCFSSWIGFHQVSTEMWLSEWISLNARKCDFFLRKLSDNMWSLSRLLRMSITVTENCIPHFLDWILSYFDIAVVFVDDAVVVVVNKYLKWTKTSYLTLLASNTSMYAIKNIQCVMMNKSTHILRLDSVAWRHMFTTPTHTTQHNTARTQTHHVTICQSI